MRKDESNAKEWAKHTRNTKYGKAGINRKARRKVKEHIEKLAPEPESSNRPLP